MTRVDFYILADNTPEARLHFACRLIDKVYRRGLRVHIATRDAQESARLDQLLWTFRPESFLPHCIDGDEAGANMDVSISIGHNNEAGGAHGVLINLSAGVPQNFSRFERLSEVVIQEESVLRQTRDNYKYYRDRGYPIQSHDLRNHAR